MLVVLCKIDLLFCDCGWNIGKMFDIDLMICLNIVFDFVVVVCFLLFVCGFFDEELLSDE